MSHLSYIIDIILCIVNLWFSSGVFPTPCKFSIIFPLIKKQGLDPEILKNYRPVANLSFISKIIEKDIATQIHDHLINNDIVDNVQSAYNEKYVGICGNALKLIKSYFSNHTQRVQIDDFYQIVLILFVVFLRDRF